MDVCACNRRISEDAYKCPGCEVKYCSKLCMHACSPSHAMICDPSIHTRLSRSLRLLASPDYLHSQRRQVSNTLILFSRISPQPQVILLHNCKNKCLMCGCNKTICDVSRMQIHDDVISLATCTECIDAKIRLCNYGYLPSKECQSWHNNEMINRLILLRMYIGYACIDVYYLIARELISRRHICDIAEPLEEEEDLCD